MDFSKFDEQVDLKSLNENIKEAQENGGTGDYPEIERLEVSEVKTYAPPIVITIDGEGLKNVSNVDVNIYFEEGYK